MQELAAYSTLAVTMSLVLTRPRVLFLGVRVGPGMATAVGVLAMLLLGVVEPTHLARGVSDLWRPFLTIFSIMVTTGVAQRVGLLDYFAARLECWIRRRSRSHDDRLHARWVFGAVFVLSALTAAVLNNDAAILLLTPLIVGLVRRCYPRRPDLVVVFAFGVFMAAGVAPLVISNPMNLILCSSLGVGFNEYATRMIPISLLGWAMTLPLLWVVFKSELATASAPASGVSSEATSRQLSSEATAVLVLLAVALGAYPIVASLGGEVWPVAAGCAVLAVAVCVGRRAATAADVFSSVSWEILLFLYCVLVIAFGLQTVGLVDRIAELYASAGAGSLARIAMVGSTSAIGSALLNNQPMAMLNLLAIGLLPDAAPQHIFPALIGGDLGPRFLPMGSLAGLMWVELLRRQGVTIRLRQFVAVGVAVTVPALLLSLGLLLLELGAGM